MELDAFGLVWYVVIFCFCLETETDLLNQLCQGPHLIKIGRDQKNHQTIWLSQFSEKGFPRSKVIALHAPRKCQYSKGLAVQTFRKGLN